MDQAFDYVKLTPLDTETSYPYKGTDTQICTPSGAGLGAITGSKNVTPNSVTQLKAAIALGPVSVVVCGFFDAFIHYSGGVITSGCG